MTGAPAAPPSTVEPTEPGWYAYSGGAQAMVFHLRETPDGGRQWSAHDDMGQVADCAWGYIEQALSVWALDHLRPVPSVTDPTEWPVCTEQHPTSGNTCIRGAHDPDDMHRAMGEKRMQAWNKNTTAAPLPGESEQATKRPDFIHHYEPDEHFGLVVDGAPLPWHLAHPTVAVPLVQEASPGTPGVMHILWVPLLADGPMPTPPAGTPDAEPLVPDRREPRWLGNRLVHEGRSVCVHNVGLTPGLWCGGCVDAFVNVPDEPGEGDRDPHRP